MPRGFSKHGRCGGSRGARVYSIVLLVAALTLSVGASAGQAVGLCPGQDVETPGIAPRRGPDGACEICCDRPGGSPYWLTLRRWHPACYPPAPAPEPTATATRRRALPPPPPTVPEDPTPTIVIPLPPGAATATPAATEVVAPPETILPTATPAADQVTPAAQQGRTSRSLRSTCVPRHAGRPVALCATGSGSGWWLYYIGPGGRVVTGPHVPFPSAETAGRQVVLRHYISGEPIWLTWHADRLQVRTGYAGKAYVFSVTREGWVRHEAW